MSAVSGGRSGIVMPVSNVSNAAGPAQRTAPEDPRVARELANLDQRVNAGEDLSASERARARAILRMAHSFAGAGNSATAAELADRAKSIVAPAESSVKPPETIPADAPGRNKPRQPIPLPEPGLPDVGPGDAPAKALGGRGESAHYYLDGSTDGAVSAQTPTLVPESQSVAFVRHHENQHVRHEIAKAIREGEKVVSVRVTVNYARNPRTGQVYAAGGLTHVRTHPAVSAYERVREGMPKAALQKDIVFGGPPRFLRIDETGTKEPDPNPETEKAVPDSPATGTESNATEALKPYQPLKGVHIADPQTAPVRIRGDIAADKRPLSPFGT